MIVKTGLKKTVETVKVVLLIAIFALAAALVKQYQRPSWTQAEFKAPNWECPDRYHLYYDQKADLASCCTIQGECYWENSSDGIRRFYGEKGR